MLRRSLRVVGALLFGAVGVSGAVPEWRLDPGFRSAVVSGSTVAALASAPEGRLVVAGQLLLDGRDGINTLVRLNPDGSRDVSFGAVNNAGIQGVAVDTEGRVLVASYQQPTVVRLAANGGRDQTFKAGAVGGGFSFNPEFIPFSDPLGFVVMSDRRVVVTGSGVFRFGPQVGFVRLNADGSVDEGFLKGSGIDAPTITRVSAVVGVRGDRVVLGGQFPQVHGIPAMNLARIEPDGRLDTTFNPGASIWAAANGVERSGQVTALALEGDGDLLAAVVIQERGFIASINVVRIRPDGTLDRGFAPGGTTDGEITSLGVLSSGRIIVAGSFRTFAGVACDSVACLNSDGSVHSVFPVAADGTRRLGQIAALSVTATDAVHLGAGLPSSGLFRILLDAPPTTGPSITSGPSDLRLEEGRELVLSVVAVGEPAPTYQWKRDGVVIPGETGRELRVARAAAGHAGSYRVVATNPGGSVESPAAAVVVVPASQRSGAVDLRFLTGPEGGGRVLDLLDLGAEGVLVARLQGSGNDAEVVRYRGDGTSVNGFALLLTGAGQGAGVRLARAGSDGWLVGGGFTHLNGVAVPPLVRVTGSGLRDAAFAPQFNAGAIIADLLALPDGGWMVVGAFSSVGGLPRPGVARLRANGAVDPAFAPASPLPPPLGSVSGFRAVRQASGGRFVVSGSAGTVMLGADGVHDTSFVSLVRAESPRGLWVGGDGAVLVATGTGEYGENGVVVRGLVPLTPEARLGAAPRLPEPYRVTAIHPLPDGRVLVGGGVGGVSNSGLVRFTRGGAVDPSFQPGTGVGGVASGEVSVIEPAADGGVWIGGSFDRFDGVVVRNLVRLWGPRPVGMRDPARTGNRFSVQIDGATGRVYRMEFRESLGGGGWSSLDAVAGANGSVTLIDTTATGSQRFYRVVEE